MLKFEKCVKYLTIFFSGCGVCKPCHIGNRHFCKDKDAVGIWVDGGWAQYCLLPDNKVHKLSQKIDLTIGMKCCLDDDIDNI